MPVPEGVAMSKPGPNLQHVADLHIQVATPIEIGETGLGARRVIPITGGRVVGPKLNGVILNAGADFQIIRPDGLTELEAKYVIEVEGGGRVYIDNFGLRFGSPEAIDRLKRGLPVDPAQIYFRCTPRFETSVDSLRWLTRTIFVGSGARYPDRVEIGIWQVD